MIFGEMNPNLDPKSISKKIFFFSYFGLIFACAIELVFSFAELIISLDDSSVMLFFYITLSLVAAQAVTFAIAYIANSKNPSLPFGDKKEVWFKVAARVFSIAIGGIFLFIGFKFLDSSFYAYTLLVIGLSIVTIQIPAMVFSIVKAFKKPANPLENIFNFQEYAPGGEIENSSSENNINDAIEVEVRDINED